MKRKRFSEEQIIAILKEHQARTAVADLCPNHEIGGTAGMSESWRSAATERPLTGREELRSLVEVFQELVAGLCCPHWT